MALVGRYRLMIIMSHSILEETATNASAFIDNGQGSSQAPAVRYETLTVHPYLGEFYKGILDGFVLTIHGRTGFANASNLCTSAQKNYKNWIRNKNNLEFIESIKNEVIPKNEMALYRLNEGSSYNDINGTYVCERILYRIAQWVSVDFSIKATGILSDFYHHRIRISGSEDELKEQIKHMHEAHEVEIKRMYEAHEVEIKSMYEVYKEQVKHIYEVEIKYLNEAHEKKIKHMNEVHKEEIEKFKKDYEEQIEGYKIMVNNYVIDLGVCKEEIEGFKEDNLYLRDRNTQLEDNITQFEQKIVDIGVDYVPKLKYTSKRPIFAIIDKRIIKAFYNLVAIRTQELRFETAFRYIKMKCPDAKLIFYSYHPNSITFLNQIRQEFPNVKTRYNDIHLPDDYSITQFIKDIHKEFSKPPRTAALDEMET